MRNGLPLLLQNGIVLWLNTKADGSGYYSVLGGSTATQTNSPVKGRVLGFNTNKFASASSQKIDTTATINLLSDYTISFWVKLTVNNTNSNGIVTSENLAGVNARYNMFLHRTDRSCITWQGQVGKTSQFTDFTGTSATGIWYHCVATCQSGTLKTYVNGIYTGNSTTYSGGSGTSDSIIVGAFKSNNPAPNSYSNYGDNTSTNIIVHNRALSAYEIQLLFISTFITQ